MPEPAHCTGGGGALAGLAGLLAALGGGIDKGRRAWGWECARVGRLRFGSGLDQTRRGKQEVVVDVSAGAEKGRGGKGLLAGLSGWVWRAVRSGADVGCCVRWVGDELGRPRELAGGVCC